MNTIEEELERTGAEYVRVAEVAPVRQPVTGNSLTIRRLPLAGTACIAAVAIGATALYIAPQSNDVAASGDEPGSSAVSQAPVTQERTEPADPVDLESPPHILLDLDGWELESHSDSTSEVGYEPDSRTPATDENGVEVEIETKTSRESWYLGPNGGQLEMRVESGGEAEVEDRKKMRAEKFGVREATVAGMKVTVTYDEGLSRIFVVGGAEGYVIELDFSFLGEGATNEDLDEILAQIKLVDLATFELALPDDAVKTADADEVVTEMLADIPVPDWFDPSAIESATDRYQTGVAVTGAVACAWIEQWIEAKDQNDATSSSEAVEALETAHDWSILIEMEDQGGWSAVMWEYVDAISDGSTVPGGRPLSVEESYEAALGC